MGIPKMYVKNILSGCS